MFRGRGGGYRGRGGSSSRGGRGGNFQRTAKGLFADGIWHCDCTPRLPAEHFKVKKEGKNQGRWFYTCQQTESKRCGFFLWDEDAKPREEAAVLSGKRTEPMGRMSAGGEVQEGWNAGRAQMQQEADGGGVQGTGLFAQKSNVARPSEGDEETASPTPSPPPQRTVGPLANTGAKRNAREAELDGDDDDAFPWPLTGQEEKELAKKADNAVPETPQKAQKTNVYATPATTAKRKLPWLDNPKQAETPISAAKAVTSYLDTPSKRLGAVSPITESLSTPRHPTPPTDASAAVTAAPARPSPPTRSKDALSNPADGSSSLTAETLSTLSPANLTPPILEQVRSILTKHDLKTQGLRKGRDMSRLALKAKEAKIKELEARIAGLENARIAELQARVVSLEAEREVDRAVIRSLRSQVDTGEKPGDGDSQETLG